MRREYGPHSRITATRSSLVVSLSTRLLTKDVVPIETAWIWDLSTSVLTRQPLMASWIPRVTSAVVWALNDARTGVVAPGVRSRMTASLPLAVVEMETHVLVPPTSTPIRSNLSGMLC